MANPDELEAYARHWLLMHSRQFALQRTLFLVPGLCDETAGCWTGPESLYDFWGKQMFSNWQPDGATPNVQLITFPSDGVFPSTPPWTNGRKFTNFFDHADWLRWRIHALYPDHGSGIGEYDVVGHSMAGLDTFAALIDDLDPTRAIAPDYSHVARAYNFIAVDTPWRGVPNMPLRRSMAKPFQLPQCDALEVGAPQLGIVNAASMQLANRVQRMACFTCDSATQVEVDSAYLFADPQSRAQIQTRMLYQTLKIPGVRHSGEMGICTSAVTVLNIVLMLSGHY